ncbi:acetolactate synthase large subunit [Brevibacterium luteolum]|uniref:Acetolactate synthase large subunit n=1 Tax=Brevibacterium luteolum TaxID=199591 RepID=A0A6G8KXC2_9MICO|nr:acetolactate synthase large subunit [Brevibacterium luteolum]QIN29296.1 acetolactate synthase large subunit [Brevibacterium luteolum]
MTNGADRLLATLEHNDIEVCFANPGTSEMHFVAALDKATKIRGVLGLFEGTVTGAADGYSRMTDRPAATLLHLGPGLANGLSNMHNALRARAGIVNVIGDHATYHRDLDAPLTSDIEGTARPFSHWVRSSPSPDTIAADTADAISQAEAGRVASLILPADTAWNPVTGDPAVPTAAALPRPVLDERVIAAAAKRLRTSGARTAILMGGRAVRADQLAVAGRIAAATGAHLLSDTFAPRTERGAGRVTTLKVPYPVGPSQELLADFDALILVDSKEPVAFFAYPDKSSVLTAAGTTFFEICPREGDALAALEALAEAVGATGADVPGDGIASGAGTAEGRGQPAELSLPGMPSGTITPEKISAFLGNAIPEGAIVVDESLTTGGSFWAQTATARPHDWFSGTGGSIGYAMPVAAGAAIACPDRPVITLESDGSGLYQPQALWTQAREGLNVVTLIFNNAKYQILRNEMANVGVPDFGPKASALLDLSDPVPNWSAISEGMGVPARRVETVEQLDAAFSEALAEPGPRLIEVMV